MEKHEITNMITKARGYLSASASRLKIDDRGGASDREIQQSQAIALIGIGELLIVIADQLRD